MMTSPRINPPKQTGDLSFPEVDSFPIWEVFTQKRPTKEHIHAGSLSAPDASLAQQFAREHYGQDQVCVSLWVGTRSDFLAVDGGSDTYELFVQWESGDRHIHIGTVEASNGQDAKSKCDFLIAALQIDPTADRPHKNKPILSLEERRIVLESNKHVDQVILYGTEDDLAEILRGIRPTIRILGSDWEGRYATGQEYSDEIYYHKRDHGWSTSDLRKRIAKNENRKRTKAGL